MINSTGARAFKFFEMGGLKEGDERISTLHEWKKNGYKKRNNGCKERSLDKLGWVEMKVVS